MKKNDLSPEAFRFEGKMSLKQALPLGMQHVLAMFVGNLTPLLIITGACGLAGGEFADLRVTLLQNAMLVAGIVTLVQLYSIGPIGGKVPIIMGTSSGFIGVFSSVTASMGGGVLAYGAIMGASLIGGLFETVLGFFLKPLRKLLPSVVTGTVVLSIGLSLISVGVNSFGGGNTAQDFGSVENLLLAIFVLVVILICKHSGSTFLNSSSILVGIICGYIAAFLMGLVLPTTALNAEGVAYTKAWVLNWNKVAEAKWFALPELMPVKPVFDMRAIAPVMIMFIVTAVETVGDISGVIMGGMDRLHLRWYRLQLCRTVRRTAQHLLQPECRPCQHDQGRQPLCAGHRRHLPDSLRSGAQAGRARLDHAAVGAGRRSCHDVLFDRGERYSAHHPRAADPAQPEHRLCSARSWLWHRCQQRHPCTRTADALSGIRRLRHCARRTRCHPLESGHSQGRKRLK